MSSVNLKAQPVVDAAAAAISSIERERSEREASVADAVIAFCADRGVLGLRRRKVPADRADAIRWLESQYGANDELLTELNAARRLHAEALHDLRQVLSAAQLSLRIGDGHITLSLHHASIMMRHAIIAVKQ